MIYDSRVEKPNLTRDAHDQSPVSTNPGFALYFLGRQGRRAFAEELREHGLQPVHYGLLAALDVGSPQNQHELAKRAGIDGGDMVAYIDTLEVQGLVQRERDARDRRSNLVLLTASGRATLKEVATVASDFNDRFFAPLDRDERELLVRLLEKLWRAHVPGSEQTA